MTPEQKQLFDRLTQLQQRVAINVLGGMSQRQAYYAAGGSANNDESADSTVHVMLSKAEVIEFMDSMKLQAVSEAVMSREEALAKLSTIARKDLKDIVKFQTVEVGKNLVTGEPLMQPGWFIPDSVLQDQDALSVISELSSGKDGVKIKTHSQIQAIAQLSKMQGWDAAQKTDNTHRIVDDGSNEW